MRYWKIAPEWRGEDCFIIGGGPSVKGEDLTALRGRKVIVVNSSYETYPEADILFWADKRWWMDHSRRPEFTGFAGKKVTVSTYYPDDEIPWRVHRTIPNTDPAHPPIGPGLDLNPHRVVSNRTSTQGAMNLAFHLGVKRIILIGVDMGRAPDGRSHHHKPHRWKNKEGNVTWDVQMEQLKLIVEPLREHGVEVINTSMQSRCDFWPKVPLVDVIGDGINTAPADMIFPTKPWRFPNDAGDTGIAHGR